jgi:UDP-N-acetyl-D-mannosaminuronate dehydrogenase
MKIGIVGFGEIGQALYHLYTQNNITPFVKDVKRDDGLENCSILNISIPYSKDFEAVVVEYLKTLKPELAIIHSTIPPGTTEKINKVFSNVVHSPVRGVHPNLLEGLKTFVKVVGGDLAPEAAKHLESLGLKVHVFSSSASTEVAKLLDTSYYGVCIAWHQYGSDVCEKLDVPFEEAMTFFNETYNDGYKKLGKENVVRPVLYPPKGKIGGHCIVHNAELLGEILDSSLLQEVRSLK